MNSYSFDFLENKPCWRAWTGLWPAIFFELGNEVEKGRGEISLCIDGCPWQIFEGNTVLINSKSEPKMFEEYQARFERSNLLKVVRDGGDNKCVFVFSNNLHIHTYYSNENDRAFILTPHQEITISEGADIQVRNRD